MKKNNAVIHSMARLKLDIPMIVNEILDKIPADRIVNGTILDPAMGGGQFVKEIERRKRAAGKSDEEIRATVHGMESNGLLVDNAINRNKLVGSYQCGQLENMESMAMKFDVIIGNPPFQESREDGKRKDQASNLWSKFWAKSFYISKDDGIIAYITPTTWVTPSADLKGKDKHKGMARLWDIFDHYTSYANIQDVQQHFPGVGSSFGYVIVDRSGHDGLTFSDGADTSLGFMPRSGMEMVMENLSTVNNIGNRFKVNQTNSPDLRVSITMSKSLRENSPEILRGNQRPTKGADDEGLYIYIHVNTEEEAAMVYRRLEECTEILYNHCRWVGYLNIKLVKLIKIPS